MTSDEHSGIRNETPVTVEDESVIHLPGRRVPSLALPSTSGQRIDLSTVRGEIVLYCFPRMGPTEDAPDPDGWESIPGAYGCTEETCSFRDHYQDLGNLGVTEVFGLSLQTLEHQRSARRRVTPPFHFLSDADHEFTDALDLPTFEVAGQTFNRRITLVLANGHVKRVFWPVHKPERHAREVISWFKELRLSEAHRPTVRTRLVHQDCHE